MGPNNRDDVESLSVNVISDISNVIIDFSKIVDEFSILFNNIDLIILEDDVDQNIKKFLIASTNKVNNIDSYDDDILRKRRSPNLN